MPELRGKGRKIEFRAEAGPCCETLTLSLILGCFSDLFQLAGRFLGSLCVYYLLWHNIGIVNIIPTVTILKCV